MWKNGSLEDATGGAKNGVEASAVQSMVTVPSVPTSMAETGVAVVAGGAVVVAAAVVVGTAVGAMVVEGDAVVAGAAVDGGAAVVDAAPPSSAPPHAPTITMNAAIPRTN